MKYTIETTENGCVETLEFADGSKFVKRSERTESGCKGIGKGFVAQLEEDGFCEEIIEKVEEVFDGLMTLNFLELAELDC